MVEIENQSLTISLNEFTPEQLIEGILEVHQSYFLDKDPMVMSYPEQRIYYLLIEIMKAAVTEMKKGA